MAFSLVVPGTILISLNILTRAILTTTYEVCRFMVHSLMNEETEGQRGEELAQSLHSEEEAELG